jgi:hypothetical protein
MVTVKTTVTQKVTSPKRTVVSSTKSELWKSE